MNITGLLGRRSVLKAGALLGGLPPLLARASLADAEEQSDAHAREADEPRMADIPLNAAAKVTVERRDQIVLIGINRPYIHNRIDPETYAGLALAYYQYDHDSSLRAAVLFGHGDNFSRGIDVVRRPSVTPASAAATQ
jgi:enoyl-CoA hydratase